MSSSDDHQVRDDHVKNLFIIVDLLKRFHFYQQILSDAEINGEILQWQAESIIENENVKVELERPECKLSVDDYGGHQFLTFDCCKPNRCLEIPIHHDKKTERTILQYAVENYSETSKQVKENLKGVIYKLIECCPRLILVLNKQGVTPLHSVIVMQATDIAEKMLENVPTKSAVDVQDGQNHEGTDENFVEELEIFDIDSDHLSGPAERGRILGAGPVFHIAALTLNTQLFDVFYEFDNEKCVNSLNKHGDNLLHSLIRYGSRAPSKTEGILTMLRHLTKYRDVTETLFKQQNKSDGLTPLQLSAKMSQHKLFEFIMSIELLYYFKDEDEDCFDVTEIDSIPTKQTMESRSSTDETGNKLTTAETNTHKSVLHLLRSHVPDKIGVHITNTPAVKAVIDIKWQTYKRYIWFWFALHLVIMSLGIWYAVVRAKMDTPFVNDEDSKRVDTALGLGICILVYGIFCVVMQIVRNINKYRRNRYRKFSFRYMSTSFIFPWCFGLLGLLIILDFGLAYTLSSYKNFLLPYVLILGWCVTLYFLQVIDYFSVFTVMLQRLITILIQFAFVMVLFLLGFSAATYLSMYDADVDDDDDTFQHFGKTVFKLLTIMVGLGDIDAVFDATYPAISISVLVMYVLLTTILLLNALIAYMSEICSWLLVYSNPGGISSTVYARLQRASVFIQLEDCLPVALLVHGQTPEEDVLTPFPDSNRKYVSLRSPKEATADTPVDFSDSTKEEKQISDEREVDDVEVKHNKTDINLTTPGKPFPLSLSSDNKVFPDDRMTLEITEITQTTCTHDCHHCENKDLFSVRSLRNTNGPDRLTKSLPQ